MRVLLVNRFFGDEQTPTSRMLGNLAEALVKRGHEVLVLSSDSSYITSPANKNPEAPTDFKGIEVHRIKIPTKWPRLLQWCWFHLRAFLKQLSLQWDKVVYLTDPPFLTAHYPLIRIWKPKSQAFLWSMDLYPEALESASIISSKHWLYRTLFKVNDWSFSYLSGAVVLGECQRAKLSHYPHFRTLPLSTLLIPPWDARNIEPITPSENKFLKAHPDLQNKSILLYAGNLGAGHRIHEIVHLAKHLQDQNRSDWVFLFVVRGQKVKPLAQLSEKLPQIRIMDYVGEELTPHLLSAATVHLITMEASWQGVIVPSKLYGCLKAGRPVMFIGPSNSGTALEIQRLRTGCTVEPGVEAPILASKLEEIRNVTFPVQDLHTRSMDAFCRYIEE